MREQLVLRARKVLKVLRVVFLGLLILVGGYLLALVGVVLWAFEVQLQRWPIFVYGRPFCVRVGDDITAIRLFERLSRLGYVTATGAVPDPGQWSQSGSGLSINLKQCPLQGQGIASGPVMFSLDWNRISSIHHTRSLEDFKELILEPELISILTDGGQAAELCRPVALEKIPPLLVDAVLLTEDRRFYSHFGIDVGSIHRALKTNIKAWRYVEGASTVPQQLVRMTLLNPEKTLQRKVNEIFLALVSDAIYSKKTILQAYLNRVYFGHWGPYPIKGVAEASFHLFGKDLSALDPAECALLAATIRAPNIINPFRHPERARNRRNMILGLLFKEGKISRDMYEEYSESPLAMNKPGAPPVRAEALLDMIRDRLPRDQTARGAHMDVLTSVEPLLQAEADAQLRRLGEAGAQAYLVICDPQVGSIIAFLAPVPPKWTGAGGSPESLLPLMAIPALIPAKQDVIRFTLTSRIMAPGSVTFRQAFETQRAVLMKQLIASVGRDTVLQTLKGFGVSAKPDEEGEIVVTPMTAMEMTRVYSLLATLGNAAPLDPGIKVLDGFVPAAPPKHLSVGANTEAMFMVNHVMKGLIPAAGKHGASDKSWLHPSVFLAKDTDGLWGVAYRQDALVLVRLPGDQNSEKKVRTMITQLLPTSESGSQGPQAAPDGITFRKICVSSGLLATSTCPEVIREPFFKGTQPTEWCPLRHESKPVRSEPKN